MHRSVLQNDKYIDFANDNTVEVIALGRLDEGIAKGDPKAATYKAKDANGNEVEYLVKYPGMTVEEINKLNSSRAGSYNDTGGIPYTCIVNPHTLEKMQFWGGGQSAKTIMDAVTEARKTLIKDHGPSIARSDLRKFEKELANVEVTLGEKGVAKALSQYGKLEKLGEKIAPALAARAKAYHEGTLMAAAAKELDAAEKAIDDGDLKAAKKVLSLAFMRQLKGTPLHERAMALKERMKGSADADAD